METSEENGVIKVLQSIDSTLKHMNQEETQTKYCHADYALPGQTVVKRYGAAHNPKPPVMQGVLFEVGIDDRKLIKRELMEAVKRIRCEVGHKVKFRVSFVEHGKP